MLTVHAGESMLRRIDEDVERQGAVENTRPLHEAIKAAYHQRVRQEDLASALGVDQATISRWANGKSIPNIVQLRQLERFSGRAQGWTDAQCGLLDGVRSVPEAIAIDPALSDDDRASLLASYYSLLDPPKRFARHDAVDGNQV